MNLLAPVSSIMNCDFQVVSPSDHINHIKGIFELKRVQNILVVRHGKVVGIINKQSFRSFYEGLNKHFEFKSMNQWLSGEYTAEEVMNKKVFNIEIYDRISLALELLRDNIFSALPVFEGGKLVGMVTSSEIIHRLAKDKAIDLDFHFV